ncbi:myelin-associated glycoprotein-like [Colossoma macropomum]|uniref:myelin-associated glycoprotein-like n=1 Tax=Colossoma macropomum TaxID=42526 RepID=UPI00186502E9|nr:myelin-associated glycoprotein-like [Colossoma macropomum]
MGTQARFLFCWLCLQVIFATVLSDVWKAEVVSEMKALVSSCVVVPCKFQYPGRQLPDSRIRGIWHKKDKKENIYHQDPVEIADSFKGRTRLLGHLGEKNCTLELDKVKDHDNDPFCFRAEIPDLDKYSFVQSCVTLSMMPDPENPQLEKKELLEEGVFASFKCSIRHTCPSHPPTITWSHSNSKAIVNNRDILNGNWEVDSLLAFIPTEDDDLKDLTCTVSFHGGKSSTATTRLHVKRKTNFFHIIIPVVAVLGTSLLFGGVCYIMRKKYRRQIQDLQSRNANGIWSRMSRMSQRFRSRRRNETDLRMATKHNNY